MTGLRAALDIGSNTIRLLVARIEGGTPIQVLDRSEFARMGKDVDATGHLRDDRIEAGIVAIGELAATAREAGAGELTAVATSAIRDAANGREFVQRVEHETGVQVEILSGDREAELTFLGATLGLDLEGGAIVVDLGGGSTEIIAAGKAGMQWAKSLQIGSGRLTERFIAHDPPHPAELEALEAHVQRELSALPATLVHCAVYTGGTASQIAALLGRPESPITLTPTDLHLALHLAANTPAARITEKYRVRAERAQVLAAGVQALSTIADFYRVDAITITRHGIREGIILDAVRKSPEHP